VAGWAPQREEASNNASSCWAASINQLISPVTAAGCGRMEHCTGLMGGSTEDADTGANTGTGTGASAGMVSGDCFESGFGAEDSGTVVRSGKRVLVLTEAVSCPAIAPQTRCR